MAGGYTRVTRTAGDINDCRVDRRPGSGMANGTIGSCGNVEFVTISRDYGHTWEELAPLPIRDANGVLRIVDKKTAYYFSRVSGYSNKPFYILDLEDNVWREGLKLKYSRYGHDVGFITRASGEKEFVFFGGRVDPYRTDNWPADTEACRETCENWLHTATVEVYNIANNTMREGKNTIHDYEQ